MWICKAKSREYLMVPNRYAGVLLNVMEDRVLSNGTEELVSVQLPICIAPFSGCSQLLYATRRRHNESCQKS